MNQESSNEDSQNTKSQNINMKKFTLSNFVTRLGFEPRTHTLKVYCSTS